MRAGSARKKSGSMEVHCEGVSGVSADVRLFLLPLSRLRRGEIPCNKKDQHWESCSSCWSVAPIWRDNVQVGERASWGRVCGRAKLLAGTLRCLHLCWRLPWDWSDAEQLGRCPKPHQRRCLWTPQGEKEKRRSLPLDPFARLSWSHSLNSSACLSFFLTPPLSPHNNHHTAASSASNSSSSPPESSHSARSHS